MKTTRLESVGRILLIAAVVAVIAGLSISQEVGEVTCELKLVKVEKTADGVKRVETTEVSPGDACEYWVEYTNGTQKPIGNVDITIPVPKGFIYVPHAVFNPNCVQQKGDASVDGEGFAPIPLTRMVKDDNGNEVEEAVSCAEYRFVRFHLDSLAAGSTAHLHIHLKVAE